MNARLQMWPQVVTSLEQDMTAMLVVELTPDVVSRAHVLLRRHSLRAGDAVQLASCVCLRDALQDEITLAACDERLLVAARKERVPVG